MQSKYLQTSKARTQRRYSKRYGRTATNRSHDTRLPRLEELEDRTLLSGIWISSSAIAALPLSGSGWENVLQSAQMAQMLPNLHDQDEDVDVLTLAKAMTAVRLQNPTYLQQVRDTIMNVIRTEDVNGIATIANPFAVETTATFSAPGTYLLRLTADDGVRHDEDQVTIRVYAQGEAFAQFTPGPPGSGQVTITGTTAITNNDPDVYAGPQQTVLVGDVVTLRGTVSDDGLPAGSVNTVWEVVTPRTLALARNLISYVIAADIAGLESGQDVEFRNWLRTIVSKEIDGRTLQSTHGDRPNNWGTMAGASRAAAALYLGDQAELEETARVFKGFLGDSSAHSGFNFETDNNWHLDAARPLGLNPKGAIKDGQSIDGAIPEEMRRGGPFQIPFEKTTYPWEALQGAVVTAELLHRAGYDAWEWQDRALLRAVTFLYDLGWLPPRGHDWIPWLVDARYGTNFRTETVSEPGKNMGWTSWTHQFGPPDENHPPRVSAGPDMTVAVGGVAPLNAIVTDDGLPNPPGVTNLQWTQVSGPASGIAQFANSTTSQTAVSLSHPGTYVLRIRADDGQRIAFDDLIITAVDTNEIIKSSFQDGLDNYTGTRDTRLRSDFPTTNFGTNTKLELDGNPDQVSLIRWDTSTIPHNAVVTTASITLNVVNTSIQDYEVYPALRPWDESTATFGLAAINQPWEIAGAAGATDHATESVLSITAPTLGLVTIDLGTKGLSMIQKWIDDPERNFGIVIQDLNNLTTDDLDFSSRELAGSGPKLTVSYKLTLPTDTFSISRPAPNQAPVAGNDSFVIAEDQLLRVVASEGALSNDSDFNGDPLTALPDSGPQQGTLILNSDGSFEYVPRADFHGSDTFTYLVNDGSQATRGTVTLVVNPVNDPPSAADVVATTNANVSVPITLAGADIDDVALTFSIVNGPKSGTIQEAGREVTYVPNSHFTGTDTFSYLVRDAAGLSAQANVTVIVVNPVPITVAFRDGLNGYQGTRDTRFRADQPTTLNGTSARLELDGNPDQTSLVRWDTSSIPSDSTIKSASLTINVLNTSIHEFEVYEALRSWDERTANYLVAATGVPWGAPGASGPTDRSFDMLTALSSRVLGTATFNFNPKGLAVIQKWINDSKQNRGIVIQDLSDESTDDLDFSAREAPGLGPMLTVTYTSGPPLAPNRSPVAVSQSVTTDEDIAVNIVLSGSDPDADAITYSLESNPANGSLSGALPHLQYTPNPNFRGIDTFQFKTNDGVENSNIATVTVNVNQVNDAPIAKSFAIGTIKDVSISLALSGSDADGDSLAYLIDISPSSGTLTGTAPALIYKPNAGFTGTDTFTYLVSDGLLMSAPAQVVVNVATSTTPLSVSFQNGMFPHANYSGTQDTKLRGDQPATTQGKSGKLEMDGKPDIGTLLKWDITRIPAGSTVQTATITINVVNASIHTFSFYQLLQPWSELTATYNIASTGIPWQNAGAQGPSDRGNSILGTFSGPTLGSATFQVNAAGVAVIQSWVDNPTLNLGFVIQNYVDASTDDLEFTSREGTIPAQRPKLTINYSSPALVSTPITIAAIMTNSVNPYDVNGDAVITPTDALIVINRLNKSEGEQGGELESIYPDVSGDSIISPLDVLLLFNYLNLALTTESEAEGEAERFNLTMANTLPFALTRLIIPVHVLPPCIYQAGIEEHHGTIVAADDSVDNSICVSIPIRRTDHSHGANSRQIEPPGVTDAMSVAALDRLFEELGNTSFLIVDPQSD